MCLDPGTGAAFLLTPQKLDVLLGARSEVVGAGTDASRTVYFKKETNNGETNNVEMLCCNHKVHHFKTSRILNNSSKKHLKH